MLRDPLPPDTKAVIWKLLREIGELRPLTREEIRLRCVCAPRPWRDQGISYSTWHRRHTAAPQCLRRDRHDRGGDGYRDRFRVAVL